MKTIMRPLFSLTLLFLLQMVEGVENDSQNKTSEKLKKPIINHGLPETALNVVVVRAQTDDPKNKLAVKNSTTATRIDASLMETPATVNVITEKFLDLTAPQRIEDATAFVPGVAPGFAFGGGWPVYSIRGFDNGSNNNNVSFVDGYQSNKSGYIQDMATIERIDVLKGTSSLLYGTARPGGIVNYVTKKPLAEEKYSIKQTFGSYDTYRTELNATGPLTDDKTLLYRAVFSGQTANQRMYGNLSSDASYDNRLLFAPSVTWNTPTGGKLDAGIEYYYQDNVYDTGIKRINGQFLYNPNKPFVAEGYSRENDYYTVKSEYKQPITEDWNVVVGGNYMFSQRNSEVYTARGATSLTGANPRLNSYFDSNSSRREQYHARTEVNGKWKWSDVIEHKLLVGTELLTTRGHLLPIGGFVTPAGTINPHDPVFPQVPTLTTNYTESVTTTEEAGFYLQDYITLYEKFHVLGGVRRIDYVSYSNSVRASDGNAIDFTIGGIYNVTDWFAPFVGYSTSTEIQSVGISRLVDGTYPPPRESDQIEIGVKSEWFNKKLATTFSVFDIEQSNKTETHPTLPNTLVITGTERSTGFEFEATGEVTQNLSLKVGYSYLDAYISQSRTVSNVGKAMNNVPQNKVSLFGLYEFHEEAGILDGFGIGSGFVYIGDRWANSTGTTATSPAFELPTYGRWDLFLTYKRDHWSGRFGVENMLNTDYVASAASATEVVQGPKCAFTGTIRYEF